MRNTIEPLPAAFLAAFAILPPSVVAQEPGRVAFLADGELRTVRLDGTDVRTVVADLGHERPITWSPSGRQLLYWKHSEIGWDIWRVGVEEGQPTNLTRARSGGCRMPRYSPSGDRIAFMRDSPEGLHVMRADGSAMRRLSKFGHRDHPPSWSPDGRELCFSGFAKADDGRRRGRCWVVAADGGEARLLPVQLASFTEASFSPVERRIVFRGGDTARPDIYVVDADGSGLVNLTRTEEESERSPRWSPDGRRIAYLASGRSGTELRVLDVAARRIVGRLPGVASFGYSWSPDASRLVVSMAGEEPEMRLFDPISSTSRRLGRGAFAAWQPMSIRLVPRPQRAKFGSFHVARPLIVERGGVFAAQIDAFVQYMRELGIAIAAAESGLKVSVVRFRRAELDARTTYRIAITEDRIDVSAATPVGAAQAAATLAQLVRVSGRLAAWPRADIRDGPDCTYRSFMVDMGRNPHSKATLRKLVDVLWFYKVNLLHLHLTDDQLFSWPSKAFPKLASRRAGWTLADFAELESHCVARGISIVPELDVPAHSTILRRQYPDVFGKSPRELATLETAQKGVETLLGEMLDVFTSARYVHIGGDEAYGVPVEAQRDLINRLHRFVKSKGRRTVVWEGPRLGTGASKVDTEVLHINWNTVNVAAQKMLDAGYEVVNAAWDPFYIVDHYPRTMFTAVDLRRCYEVDLRRFGHVDPGMPTFAKPHRAKTRRGIVGFCMPWWEGREQNLFALCVPRIAAVAAAAWNRAGETDFDEFVARQKGALVRLADLSGVVMPPMPRTPRADGSANLALGAAVRVSTGAAQPHFGPQRLTNGIVSRFDHFLGFPTKPKPLEIVIDLGESRTAARVVVHETAVGKSHEVYEVFVAAADGRYRSIGTSGKGTRGDASFVAHRFESQKIRFVKIVTRGCHGLTFPSFSRLTEVEVFPK